MFVQLEGGGGGWHEGHDGGRDEGPSNPNRKSVILAACALGSASLLAAWAYTSIPGKVRPSGSYAERFMAGSSYAVPENKIPQGGLDTQVACDMQEQSSGKFVVKTGNSYFLNPNHALAYNLAPNGVNNLIGAYQMIYGGELGKSLGDDDNIELTTKGDDVTISGLGIGAPGEGPSKPVKHDLSGKRYEFGTYGLLEYDISKFSGRFVVAISCDPAVADHIASAWNAMNAAQPQT